ncbi:metallophosphoesterase [Rhodococcus sp. NPDC057014]|uniref:metallophosphoesterase family protein n=1 Tax=Rhodococcus sp. NPDC057014 TaxID=3346000 RepID=UPI00362ACAD8
MIRVAAVGDVHLGVDSRGTLRPGLENVPAHADVLLLAGDLTRHGGADEAGVVADEFADLGIPVIAVLGNHDYHGNAVAEVTDVLRSRGMAVLEGDSVTVDIDGQVLGVAGIKGFGGGFAGKCASVFGEPQMKDFAGHTVEVADRFRTAVASLQADVRVALLHYSPISDTLHGEPPEIYPFLGSYLLGEPIDEFRLDLALHGHAHAGCERGTTPGGVRVRNVAQPVIRAAYAVYGLGSTD